MMKWTRQELENLKYCVNHTNLTNIEISKNFNRSVGSIERALNYYKIPRKNR